MGLGPSPFSLAACGLYAAVAVIALWAGLAARRYGQPRSHWVMWAALAALFTLLIVGRLLTIEDVLRDGLRDMMREQGTYRSRRALQGPIVAAFIVVGGMVLLYLLAVWSRSFVGRRNRARFWALMASIAMLGLVLLRLISLHAIDVFLYGLPKLNWIVDIGASLVVLWAAVRYTRLVRARP